MPTATITTAVIAEPSGDRAHKDVHGELDCNDAEAILAETAQENLDLRARLRDAQQEQDRAQGEAEAARIEADRLRALLDSISEKNMILVRERDDLAAQVKYLNEELGAAEADAVPEGTLLYSALSREEMVATYRAASRIGRGPLPPAVLAAVAAASDDIAATMREAGREALTDIIRREVRRRRRARSPRR